MRRKRLQRRLVRERAAVPTADKTREEVERRRRRLKRNEEILNSEFLKQRKHVTHTYMHTYASVNFGPSQKAKLSLFLGQKIQIFFSVNND